MSLREPDPTAAPTLHAADAYRSYLESNAVAHYPELLDASTTVHFGLLTVADFGDLQPDGSLKLRVSDAPVLFVVAERVAVTQAPQAYSAGAEAKAMTIDITAFVAVDATTGDLVYEGTGTE